MSEISKLLKDKIGKEVLFFDGAMGTRLQEAGLDAGEYPEDWNVDRPDVIKSIQKSYLEAGSQILLSNTFGSNPVKMTESKYSLKEQIFGALDVAHGAIEEFAVGSDAPSQHFVALDLGPTGKLLEPMGDLSFDEAYSAFAKVIDIANEHEKGYDCILLQTMTDEYEIKAGVLAAKEHRKSEDVPVFVMAMVDEKGNLLSGTNITAIVALLEGLKVDALGFNCGFGPDIMLPFVKELSEISSTPIIVLPNAGLPTVVDGVTTYTMSPTDFADAMEEIAKYSPWLLGGCCGTTQNHIAEMIKRLKDMRPEPVTEKGLSLVSSGLYGIDLSKGPFVVGEKLNPTGNKPLAKAYREEDYSYVLNLAKEEKMAGAHVLELNVGLPDLDEEVMLPAMAKKLQAVIDLPFMLDCTNPVAMEKAVRYYHGKAIINSVNAKEESMEQVFPIAAKYGAMVVGLTLDENGIPDTAEGRFALAKKLVERAAEYGIKKENIIIDPLTLTISTNAKAADITLDSLKMIKEGLGVCTTMGVSNVSFGLPDRETINQTFYAMALDRGLDAGIVNPFSKAMMDAFRGDFRAPEKVDFQKFIDASLAKPKKASASGRDARSKSGKTSNEKKSDGSASLSADPATSLKNHIIDGFEQDAAHTTQKLLEKFSQLEIINNCIIPALDLVGERFEKGTLFLPQLLMSAQAAASSFEVIKASFGKEKRESKGKIVLATVKGDIHDIGKNIVKVLLENYDFEVIDLGKDVPPEEILAAAKENSVKLVGLSALMTTTIPFMEETIALLHKEYPDCKVVVGGAVLTEDYAKMINADKYAKDAMATVRYAEEVLL